MQGHGMAAGNAHQTPRVFISSTVKDLAEYRRVAEKAASKEGFLAQLSEDWEASAKRPLRNCLERVDQCHLVVAIVADWHGWTPGDPDNTEHKSITRLECERAVQNGYLVIPFLLDPNYKDWPTECRESYRATQAIDDDMPDDDLANLQREIKRNKAALRGFRQWLETEFTRNLFTTSADLEGKLGRALRAWLDDNAEFKSVPRQSVFDEVEYLDWVRRQSESVELLGVDQRDTHNVRLQHVYVPARVESERTQDAGGYSRWILLTERIGNESLYVPGAPGAGKSTFCRWLAPIVAAGDVPRHPIAAPDDYIEAVPETLQDRMPVLCYLRDFNDHKALLHGSGRWYRHTLEQALGLVRCSAARWADGAGLAGTDGSGQMPVDTRWCRRGAGVVQGWQRGSPAARQPAQRHRRRTAALARQGQPGTAHQSALRVDGCRSQSIEARRGRTAAAGWRSATAVHQALVCRCGHIARTGQGRGSDRAPGRAR
jgi:hypothetical protein